MKCIGESFVQAQGLFLGQPMQEMSDIGSAEDGEGLRRMCCGGAVRHDRVSRVLRVVSHC